MTRGIEMRAEVALPAVRERMDMKNFPSKRAQRVLGIFRRFKGQGYEDRSLPLLDIHAELKKFNERQGTRLTLITPQVAEAVLNDGTGNWIFLKPAAPFPTSVMVAYERPGQPFGSEVIFNEGDGRGVVVPTGSYKGAKNIALLLQGVTADDFRECGRETIVEVPESRIMPIEDFPTESCWLRIKSGILIHTGAPADQKEAREIMEREIKRVTDSAYVGSLIRDVGFHEYKRTLSLHYPLSFRLGAVVEVPSHDIEKLGLRVEQGRDPENDVRNLRALDTPESQVPQNGTLREIKQHLPPMLRGELDRLIEQLVKIDRNNFLKIACAHLPKRLRSEFEQILDGLMKD